MRRRLYALALCLLPLSACSLPYYDPGTGGGRYGPMPEDAADYLDAPLHARIYEDGSGLRVQLNRPAYVAIFEVAPGLGASLVYPEFQSERSYLNEGTNRVWLSRRTRGSMYYGYDVGNYATRQPRHFLLIASREPLRLRDIQERPSELRRQLGYTTFTSMNARTVMNQIADMVLPAVNDEEWDSDVLTLWPQSYTRLASVDDDRMTVRCPDGRVVTTYTSWLQYACYQRGRRYGEGRGGGQVQPPPSRDTTSAGDSSRIRVPGRRRPEPAGGDTLAAVRIPTRIAADPSAGDDPRNADEPRHTRPGGVEPAADPDFRPREQPRLEPRHVVARPAGEGRRSEPRADEPRRAEPAAGAPADAQPGRRAREPREVAPRQNGEPYVPREEPRSEPRQETRSEPRAEPRSEPRQEPRAEPRSEPRQESRPEPRHESPPPPAPAREAPRAEPPPRSEPVHQRPAEPAPPPR
jgi:hypothetical protein